MQSSNQPVYVPFPVAHHQSSDDEDEPDIAEEQRLDDARDNSTWIRKTSNNGPQAEQAAETLQKTQVQKALLLWPDMCLALMSLLFIVYGALVASVDGDLAAEGSLGLKLFEASRYVGYLLGLPRETRNTNLSTNQKRHRRYSQCYSRPSLGARSKVSPPGVSRPHGG